MKVLGKELSEEEKRLWSLLDDDGKLRQRIVNKRVNANAEGFAFEMSTLDILLELEAAGIKSSDWKLAKYSLARYNDTGDYVKGNCRFITQQRNAWEKKSVSKSDKLKGAIYPRRNIEQYQEYRKKKALENRKKYEDSCHESYLGSKNSQFGKIWITDGKKTRKILSSETIPQGWRRGRTLLGE